MHSQVAIVGSGFSGIAMGIRLLQTGKPDFQIYESGASVGGTWRDNTYPGAACDIPSHLYSLSFAPKTDWSHHYARGPEIRAYLEDCVDRFALRSRIHLQTPIDHARWDTEKAHWELTTASGETHTARFVVFGVGGLRDPLIPEIPGTFEGAQMHSARWDASVDLTGRVGIVGTGASAIQLMPEVAKSARELTVFQRTPPWIRPRGDRAFSDTEKRAFARVPGLRRTLRLMTWARHEMWYPIFFGRFHRVSRALQPLMGMQIRAAVGDLADTVTPTFQLGCKRVLTSDDWYPALLKPHVHVETSGITQLVPEGVQLKNGQTVPLDTLIWCTGFQIADPLGRLNVTGEDDQDLRAYWGDRPRAYLGITTPKFPNAFMLMGPNTALGHSSVVSMIESQVEYVLQALDYTGPQRTLCVRQHALDTFLAEVDRRHATRVWQSGCESWYLNRAGKNFTIWPGSTLSYFRQTRRFDAEAYITS